MSKRSKIPREATDPITTRLDAIIRLMVEGKNPKNEEGITVPDAVRVLYSAGLRPTEIARILGLKNATSVAPYLYSKE
ncbi:MAG: hypothetical protein ABSB29_06190 [Nitrososphaerales archaeon]